MQKVRDKLLKSITNMQLRHGYGTLGKRHRYGDVITATYFYNRHSYVWLINTNQFIYMLPNALGSDLGADHNKRIFIFAMFAIQIKLLLLLLLGLANRKGRVITRLFPLDRCVLILLSS